MRSSGPLARVRSPRPLNASVRLTAKAVQAEMTLVLNEIHVLDGFRKTFIIAAADRRLSKLNGTYDSTRRKLFPIHYLGGAISYFGLATIYPHGRLQYLSHWLPSFIRGQSSAGTLRRFAENLTEALKRLLADQLMC